MGSHSIFVVRSYGPNMKLTRICFGYGWVFNLTFQSCDAVMMMYCCNVVVVEHCAEPLKLINIMRIYNFTLAYIVTVYFVIIH